MNTGDQHVGGLTTSQGSVAHREAWVGMDLLMVGAIFLMLSGTVLVFALEGYDTSYDRSKIKSARLSSV